MKYLIAPDGFWKIDEITDELFWYPSPEQYPKIRRDKRWIKQQGVKASESHALNAYPEISGKKSHWNYYDTQRQRRTLLSK